MVATDIVEEDTLVFQAGEFSNQGQGDHFALAKGGARTRTMVVGLDEVLVEFIDDDIDIGAQILEGLYHGPVSLMRLVLATASTS